MFGSSSKTSLPVERLAANRARLEEALTRIPDLAERRNKGQQFNAYDLDDDGDSKAVSLGPITSQPLSLVEAPADIADLIEAALRFASDATLFAAPAPEGGATGAKAVIRNGQIVISVDVDALPLILSGSIALNAVAGTFKVTDAATFAKEVCYALNAEKEAQRIRAPQSAETIMDNVELWQCGSVNITRTRLTYGDLRKAVDALAALQAEQKGGA